MMTAKEYTNIEMHLSRMHLKGIIFDVDGTLYNQKLLYLFMIYDFFKFFIWHPHKVKELKIIRDFRKSRENNHRVKVEDLETMQYIWGARRSNVSQERVRKVICKWMFERPLKYLRLCRRPGVKELFSYLQENGLLIGIFSDYPASEKIKALELFFNIEVCATDTNINRLKPDPKGLLTLSKKMEVPVENCLFIGDRDEKDGECARRAGMPYLILDPNNKNCNSYFHNFVQLTRWVKTCIK